jgi:hypothetical protein
MKAFSLLSALLLWLATTAQEKVKLTETESFLLSLLTRDTTSSVVCHLPEGFSYGIKTSFPLKLIVAKNKKEVFFLVDGTQRVYVPDPKDPLSGLVRIDSSRFEGDNYGLMPFIRRDSLYQYGGYGFWQNRDFMSRFSRKSGEWEIQSAENGVQSGFSPNYYDPENDKYYTLRSHLLRSYRSNTPMIIDSVRSFDWNSQTWKILGKSVLPPKFDPINCSSHFVSGIGFFTSFPQSGNYLFNPAKNVFYTLTPKANEDFFSALSNFDKKNLSPQFFFLHLQDTLYFIGSRDSSLHIEKMQLDLSSFDTAHPQPIYEPLPKTIDLSFNIRLSMGQMIIATLSTLALALLAFLLVSRRRKMAIASKWTDASPWQNPNDTESRSENGHTNMEHPISQNHGDEISYFLANLSATENNLLKMIIVESLQDKKTDINAINKILGVANKDTQIQKTRRSVVVNRINETFIQTTKINATLIDKIRDEFDKRSFVYFVPEEFAKRILPALQERV